VLDPESSIIDRGGLTAMAGKTKKRVSVSISMETKAMLDSVKHTGQSYNGLLQELVAFWNRQKGAEGDGGQSGSERSQIDNVASL